MAQKTAKQKKRPRLEEIQRESNIEKAAEVLYLREATEIVTESRGGFSPRAVLDLLSSMLACLEEKDAYTHGHSLRVTEYSTALGFELGFTEAQIEELQVVAMLHDIGKVGIPDNVLLKPAPLTRAEFEIMKSHPVRSARILEKANAPKALIDGARSHHERIDGLGYPDGLKGEEIPLYARMVLIADTFDAMTSTRPYRLALDNETAFSELAKYSGTQFDLKLVGAFVRAIKNPTIQIAVEKTLFRKIS
jgi:putative nucleotidyltransferase with HDIG domain